MITTKKHNKIISELKEEYAKKHAQLTQELKEAKDLKEILQKMSSLTINGNTWGVTGGSWNISTAKLELNDTIAQYVDDYFGGKVIKQEATKVIEITSDGKMVDGYTKQKPDDGYKYKLIRKDNIES